MLEEKSQVTDEKIMLASTNEGLFFIDLQDKYIGHSIAKYGVWEATETAWFKSILRSGDCVIDVGANLGWYTIVGARLVGPEGRVLSFEPDPYNFGLLKDNVTKNGFLERCYLFQVALLEQLGVCRLELCPNNLGDHRVRFCLPNEGDENLFVEDQRSTIAVKCDSLDAIRRQAGLEDRPTRLLKMDCQGAEIAVLKGASQTLATTDYLLTEYWPYAIHRSPYSAGDLVECVTESFYEFGRLSEGDIIYQPIDKLASDLTRPMSVHSGVHAYTMYIFRKKMPDSV